MKNCGRETLPHLRPWTPSTTLSGRRSRSTFRFFYMFILPSSRVRHVCVYIYVCKCIFDRCMYVYTHTHLMYI
jgi:hypothetical protein